MTDITERPLPDIRTAVPGPKARAEIERVKRRESPVTATFGMSPHPPVIARGEGVAVEDPDGNLYLDFAAGFGVLNTGHGHPRVVAAIRDQAATLAHVMGAINPVRADLADALQRITPGTESKRILFGVGGGEAVDMALRLVREATGKYEVLAFWGAYHGRTQGALALMGRGSGRKGFAPMVAGAVHAPYPYCYRCPFGQTYPDCGIACARHVENVVKGRSTGVAEPAAIFIEPIQGNGGMIAAPAEFLQALRRICDETGTLLVFDEVMSGMGRTGRFFYSEHSGVVPDVLVVGKAVGGGLPLSAVVAREALTATLAANRDSSTLSGNPIACAAALATIGVLESEGLIQNATEMGEHFRAGLSALAEEFAIIGDVRGVGLMLGFEMVSDRTTKEPLEGSTRRVTQLCLAEGLILYPAGGHNGNVVGFLPPLTVERRHVDAAIEVLRKALTAYTREIAAA